MWSRSSSFSSRRPLTPPPNPKLCCFRCSFPPPLIIGKNQHPRVRKCSTFVRSRTRTRNNDEKMTVPQQRKDDDDDIGDFDGSKMIDDDNLDEDVDEDDMEFFKAAASLQFGASNKKKVPIAPGFYVVSTPIGNLEDITIRALKILNEATLILCEDTRKTRQLLTLLGVQSSSSSKGKQKKLLAYHSHNFYEQRETLRDRIVRNEDEEVIALVSDAGAPVVSDPGQDLVDLVLEANGGGGGGERKSVVVPIPGASAVTTAVIGSGFKCDDGYRFCGFLPAKKNERVKVLESLTSETSLLVFFVSPHKLVKTLEDVAAVYSKLPPRRVCVARELTKRHEEFFRGTCEECLEEFSKEGRARGEITLLVESSDLSASTKKTLATKVAPKNINDDDDTNDDDDDESDKNTAKVLLEKTLRHLLLERAENQRLSVSEAARKVSQDLGVKRRVAYSLAQKIKDSSSGNTNNTNY